MSKTTIGWCDHSINPLRARDKSTGKVGHYCEKVAGGCAHCYASALQQRFGMPAFGSGQKREQVELFLDDGKLKEVRRRKKPTRYFWCDMTDLFGDWVKPEWIEWCFETMLATPQHTHLLLTKRPQNVCKSWPKWTLRGHDHATEPLHMRNVWLGTSVATQHDAEEMIPRLVENEVRAGVLFVSYEPATGPLDLSSWLGIEHDRDGSWRRKSDLPTDPLLDWVIVGGESGPHRRECDTDWLIDVVRQCQAAGVACYVKQDSGLHPGQQGRLPDHIWNVKEFPKA